MVPDASAPVAANPESTTLLRSAWLWPAVLTAVTAVAGQLFGAWIAGLLIAVVLSGAAGVIARASMPDQRPVVSSAVAVIVGATVLIALWVQRDTLADERKPAPTVSTTAPSSSAPSATSGSAPTPPTP